MLLKLFLLTAILQYGVIGIKEEPRCKCVKPTTEEVQYNPCPTGECLTLMDYAKYPENFSNDTTFKFLPGNHSLDGVRIHIHYVNNLTLSGLQENGTDSGLPIVQCSGPISGFWFEDTLNLQIDSLGFNNCGFYQYKKHSQALLMQYVTNLYLYNVLVQNSSGYGLYFVDLKGSSFFRNIVIEGSHNNTACLGGNMQMIYQIEREFSQHSLQINDSFLMNGFISGYNNCSRHEGYASGLGVLLATTNSISITLRNVTLSGNTARNGGNLAISYVHLDTTTAWTSSVTLDNCTISNGTALLGGGMYLSMVARQNETTNTTHHIFNVITVNDTIFEHNTGLVVGGGMYMKLYGELELSAGAHIHVSNSVFRENSVQHFTRDGGGVAINILNFGLAGYKHHQMPQYDVSIVSCQFYDNRIETPLEESPIGSGILYFEQSPLTNLRDNEIFNNNCSGVVLIRSNLVLQGKNTIFGNTGIQGGGMMLCDNSILYLDVNASLDVSCNTALTFGGGLYVESECAQAIPPCFFQYENITDSKNINLENNTAVRAGNALYGGSIDYCYFFGHYDPANTTKAFFDIFTIFPPVTNDTSSITSDPQRVCFCSINNSRDKRLTKDCNDNGTERHTNVYPGSTFKVPLVIVGERYGTVPGVVIATNVSNESSVQSIKNNKCITLTYSLASELMCSGKEGINIAFSVQGRDSRKKYSTSLSLSVTLKPCPLGFAAQDPKSLQCGCICHQALRKLDRIECKISNTTIYKHRHSKSWFGFLPRGNRSDFEIGFYHYCPFDYCNKTVTHAIQITRPWTADDQCAFNRSGILCGHCNGSLSLVLGSSRCSDCSGKYSYLRMVGLVTAFGVAGIVLVFLLGTTDMTVAGGTLNSLIFYANVVAVNRSIFLSVTNKSVILKFIVNVLRVFISWMNLDLGIEVCFYDGMGAIGKVLLQYTFPLYLWFISGAVIILCRKFHLISKYLGRNSVQVLSTIILLSYAKLLRSILDGLFYTPLYHSSGGNTKVWRMDGNIHYLGGKHTILYALGAIMGLITFPYALVLLFIQCLRRRSNMKVFFWVNKFKPFFDAYTGPYKDNYHFWTGFLLVVRLVVFALLAIIRDPISNLTLIGATTAMLPLFLQLGIYKNRLLTFIELFTYTNLTVFSIATAHIVTANYDNTAVVILCVGSVFLLFCGIVVYHILKKLSVTRRWGLMKVWLLDRRWPWMKRRQIRSLILPYVDPDNDEDLSSSDSELDPILQNAPPVARYDKYREPLMD